MNTLEGFTQATQEMKDALVVAKEFRENYDGPDRQNRIWEVFDALISLIGSDESQPYFEANKTDELTYDKDELVEEMSKLHNLWNIYLDILILWMYLREDLLPLDLAR